MKLMHDNYYYSRHHHAAYHIHEICIVQIYHQLKSKSPLNLLSFFLHMINH